MNQDEKAALAAAASALIEDSDAPSLYDAMEGVLELARKGLPVALTGRAAIMNPLIRLAQDNSVDFEKVMELIEAKRRERALPPLESDDEKRRVYMRDFMAVKRDRQRRLMELWNQLRSENDKIRGTRRLEFERVHANRWIGEKDRREKAARESLGRRLSMDERRRISEALWSDVDEELNLLEAFVRDEIRKPLHARSKEGFKFTVGKL